MAVLYVALGIILGGLSGVIMMAMFFVAKRAEEGEDKMSNSLSRGVNHQEIPSSSCDL